VPNVRAGANAAGRPAPPVIAEFVAVLTHDTDELAQVCATDLMIYPMMPFYRAMWEAAGVPLGDRAVAGGWSPQMIDASIAHGDEHSIARRIDEYYAAGADEVIVSPMGTSDASRDDCLRVLADIAHG
jgi:alkanesulfonate monooxygenase SsuD/methylene tetrahydromethanopterin reductase-like flavin-dependent oxidoreductase (luciferase family)